MKVKIVSDGTADGTRVYDMDTGQRIEGVTAVEWSCAVKERARVRLTVLAAEVELEGEAEHAKCDGCGHYACDCICDFLWPTHPANVGPS